MFLYELTPTDGRKSFYGKAQVAHNDDGSRTLFSYGTKILTITATGDYVKHWHGWSYTTGRHIIAFCGLNKKQFESLEG